jgi:archaellum component FlaC
VAGDGNTVFSEYEEKVRLIKRIKDIKEELTSLQEKVSMINRSL